MPDNLRKNLSLKKLLEARLQDALKRVEKGVPMTSIEKRPGFGGRRPNDFIRSNLGEFEPGIYKSSDNDRIVKLSETL